MTTTQPKRMRSILGGSAGNLVEWYDWYAYAALGVYFAPSFFPKSSDTLQLLNVAAVYAVGFLMRPLGGWAMGIYGDRHGRKAGLSLAVGLMCAGSLMIACAPTYAQIGWFAPAILLFARLLQGFSVGGEYGASATYLSEMAVPGRRGFYSSFQYVTLIAGQLAALGVLILLQALLPEPALESWGWRLPFVLGAALAFGVYRLRRGLAETAAYEAIDRAAAPASSIRELWKSHRRSMLTLFALTAGGSCAFYAYTTYLQKYLINTSGFDRQQATWITALALLLFMAVQPLFGALSDRIGRRPLMIAGAIAGMIITVPVFAALKATHDPVTAFFLALVPLLVLAPYTAVSAVIKAELFPAHVRTLGVALPYAVGNALFGGTAEPLALWLKLEGREGAFFWYVTAMLGVALVALLTMREPKRAGLLA